MVNYFKALLPVTTIVDDLFVPDQVDETFYKQKRFFIIGLHCTAWMKIFVVLAIITCIVVSENILEDAIYIKADIYDSGRNYRNFIDVLVEWEPNTYSFKCLCVCFILITIAGVFMLTMITEVVYPLIPMQIVLFVIFHYLLESMVRVYSENICATYEVFSEMDESLMSMRHFRERDTLFIGSIGIHSKYEPAFRNTIYTLGIVTCMSLEYFIERIMQFYGYERFLIKINRPVIIAYRKWQFKRMMNQRRKHQMAHLVQCHQNINGNFTWNGILMDESLHTAISPDTTLQTAIEFDEEEYEEAKRAQAALTKAKSTQFNKSCKF